MQKVIFSQTEIENACTDIGKKLTKELKSEKRIPIVVGVMKGSMNFMMDLIKHIDVDFFIDYIQVSSYNGTKTTGKVVLKRDLSFDVKDRTIILVEDIIDTGLSMSFLLDFMKERYKPKRIILVALFDKKFRRKKEIKIDYVGKVLTDDDFLIGYGLDYNEMGRNLPEVYAIDDKDIRRLSIKLEKD